MKVRELATSLSCDGATTLAVIGALGSILDAEVIGLPCPTCGGSGACQQCEGCGSVWLKASSFPCASCKGTGACPDCTDTPVYVIAPEAMEAAATVLGEAFFGTYWDRLSDAHKDEARAKTHDILQVLLPGARVAKEVGHLNNEAVFLPCMVTAGKWLRAGTPIAILAKQEGE